MPFVDGFEETEALAVVDVLRWADIEIDMIGISGTQVTGMHGIKVIMDKRLKEAKLEDYDGIVLPGGTPGYENLDKSDEIQRILKNFNESGKLIGAICYSPMLLAKAGVLDDKTATVYPGFEQGVPYPREGRVIIDGNVITSQGPGTAIEFALKIIETIKGPEKARKIMRAIVA